MQDEQPESIATKHTTAIRPEQVRLSIDPLAAAQREANFLRMIDRKAPILYEKQVVRNAVRRYETYWLPLQAKKQDANIIPPLDVHWVWHCHMLSPTHYRADCESLVGAVIDHYILSSQEMQRCYDTSVKVWQEFCDQEPYDVVTTLSTTTTQQAHSKPYKQKSSYDICAAAQRQKNFNYQISLPHYTSTKFLDDAVRRYRLFLTLKATYPREFLTPCYDFDVVWHAHQVHPSAYHADCMKILGKMLPHDDSVDDRNAGSKLRQSEAITRRLWAHHFPNEPFWCRGAMFRGHSAPSFLGFENRDLLTHGYLHIQSITLKDWPAQREHLKIKLSYGTKTFSKKVPISSTHFNAKEVTKNGFCLVWQSSGCGSPTVLGTSSVVKFPFEKQSPQDLLIQLDLFDKVFLLKKKHIRLIGQSPLEELLPSSNSKLAQNVATVTLRAKDACSHEADLKARVSITTTLSAVTLTRELQLQLSVGELRQTNLVQGTRLYDMCQIGALRKSDYSSVDAWVGTHTLVDYREGVEYTVQVMHSAQCLLSMILVYGKDQRPLAMAHLIGADCLPSKQQLDTKEQHLPQLSSADERAMVVLNKHGDYAIVKAKWHGFRRKVEMNKAVVQRGEPGKLHVEVFNLLQNTLESFQLPEKIVVGGACTRLWEKRIQCQSILVAEHIACVFSVATLFVLCNPDKVRDASNSSSVGFPCHEWPLVLACGYGKTSATLFPRGGKCGADGSACGACGGCGGGGGCGGCGGGGGCGGCGGGGGCGGCGGCGG